MGGGRGRGLRFCEDLMSLKFWEEEEEEASTKGNQGTKKASLFLALNFLFSLFQETNKVNEAHFNQIVEIQLPTSP